MGVLTGERAAIDGLSCISFFEVRDLNLAPEPIYCSASKGGPVLAVGNDDWSAVAAAYSLQPPHLPGDTLTFTAVDRNGTGIQGPAIVERLILDWDVESAAQQSYVMMLAGNGAAVPGNYDVTDAAVPDSDTCRKLKAVIDDEDFSIRRARLTLLGGNPHYVDTSTSGNRKRAAGNKAAIVDLVAYFDDYTALPVKKSFVELKLEVPDDPDNTFWVVNYVLIQEVRTRVVLRPDGQGRGVLNEVRIRGVWSGFSAGEEGSLTAPDETAWWPTS